MAFTPQAAELVGASIASVLYGVYSIMFPATVYVLWTRNKSKTTRRSNALLLLGTVLLFCFITAHWLIDQLRLWIAFIDDENKFLGPLRLYGLLRDPRNVLLVVFFVLEVITVDILLLYRLYVIWNKDWRIVLFPFLTFIATVVTIVFDCIGFATAPPYVDLWKLDFKKWIYAGFTLSLTTNILAIVLIAVRIMYRNQSLQGMAASNLNPIVLILIESAALYCFCNLMIMGGVIAHSNFFLLAFTIASPVTGISFCLITLRVGLGDVLTRISKASFSAASSSGHSPHNGGAYPMVVHIKREEDSTVTEHGSGAKRDRQFHAITTEVSDSFQSGLV